PSKQQDLVGALRNTSRTNFRVMSGFGDIKFGVTARVDSTNYFGFLAGDSPDFIYYSVGVGTAVSPKLHIGGPAGVVILTRDGTSTSRSYYSLNGRSFSSRTMTAHNPNGLAYGNGLYVAVGESGTIWYTPNVATTSWTRITPFSVHYIDVVYGGPLGFVALASTGTNPIVYSSDGINWTRIS